MTWASQVGIVISKKAIIYADIERKSPIGYVKKGKRLAVGEVKRRQGEVLPVDVNGKLGWIETKNLRLPDEEKSFDKGKKVTEHEVLIEDKIKDPLDQNNFVSLKTGPSQFSASIESSLRGAVDMDLESGQETTLLFEHRNPYLPYSWGIGLEYLTATVDNYNIQSLSFKGGLTYIPIRFKYINLELYGNVLLSGDFRVQSAEIGEYKGNMYGLDYGGLVRVLPSAKFGAFAGIGMSLYKTDGLENIENIEDDDVIKVTSVNATKIFAGISYRF